MSSLGRWATVGDSGEDRFDPVEPIPPGDKEAAFRFAQELAAELVDLIEPVNPRADEYAEEHLEEEAQARAGSFIVAWRICLIADDCKACKEARERLEEMIRNDSDPRNHRALNIILIDLGEEGLEVPERLNERLRFCLRVGLSPPPSTGKRGKTNPEGAVRLKDWHQNVVNIVGYMEKHPTLRAAGIKATRNDASPPCSICDALGEALSQAGQHVDFDGVRRIWKKHRGLLKEGHCLPLQLTQPLRGSKYLDLIAHDIADHEWACSVFQANPEYRT